MKELVSFFTLDPSNARIFWAQIIGFISLAIGLFTFALSKRRSILIAKLLCDFTSAIHFFMLGATVGGAVCTVNSIRSIVFYYRDKKRWASHISVPVLIIALTLGCSLLSFSGWYSLLPTVGSVLAVIGFWQRDTRLIKLFNLPAVSLWLVYNIISGSISSVISNAVSVVTITVSLLIALIKHSRSEQLKIDNKKIIINNKDGKENGKEKEEQQLCHGKDRCG